MVRIKSPFYIVQFEKKENFTLDIDYPIISTQLEEENFYITEGKKRGLSTQISRLLGVSRQSVEKAIKTGNIYELRNLTIAILKAMDSIQ